MSDGKNCVYFFKIAENLNVIISGYNLLIKWLIRCSLMYMSRYIANRQIKCYRGPCLFHGKIPSDMLANWHNDTKSTKKFRNHEIFARKSIFYDLKIISIVLLIFVVFLDHLDGDLARFRNETSSYGAKIDTISDRLRGFIMVISIGFILLKSYVFMPFVPLILFIINEFVIIYLRPKNENYNFRTRLVYNLDFLGWVPFSYIFPFIILLPINYLVNFYIFAAVYVLLKFLITLFLRFLNFNK